MAVARLSFRAKLLLIIGLAIAATGAVRVVAEIITIEQRGARELNSLAEAATRQGAKSLATAVWELNRDQAAQILAGLALNPDFVSAVVTDQVGDAFIRLGSEESRPDSQISATADIYRDNSRERKLIGGLTVTLSRDRVSAQQRTAIVSAILGTTANIMAVFLAALIGVYLITRPMEAIVAAMLRVAKGQTDLATPYVDRRDQLGALANAVESFRFEIGRRKGVEEKLRAARAQLEARVAERTTELRLLSTRLQHLIDASPHAIISIDNDYRLVAWNPAAERIFGYTTAEVIGRRYPLVPEGGWPEFERLFRRITAGEQLRDVPLQRKSKDGRMLDIIFSGAPLYDDAGSPVGVGSLLEDVTERKKMQEQLMQAQKMEAVGQLTGGIAHDFNNMLTVITGTIDILADAVADDPQLAAIATLICEAADRGAELTGHLLAFARKQPLQPRETDINTLMIESIRLMRPTLGEQIEIETMLEDDVWPALVDPGQLSAALLNLALNSRDAMPNGGKLTIETSNVVLDRSYARTDSEVTLGNYVMIAVSDTGTGIPEAIREKVFEPFFSTKGVGKGTGLGLSMVYGFVKQSGGQIKIYSEEGHGTTFRIYLPQAGGVQSRQPAEAGTSVLEGRNETILVVEDDALVRTYVNTQLHSLGYKTISAANAGEALAITDSGAAFDLLFTDVVMPGVMNGRQLADAMATRRPGVKVLFTSGYTEDAIIHHGRLDPGILLLAKPYRKSDLARMVRTALEAEPSPQQGGGIRTKGDVVLR